MDKVKIDFVSVVTGFPASDIVTIHLGLKNKYGCLPNARINLPVGEGLSFAQDTFPNTKITLVNVDAGGGLPVLKNIQESK
jgi:hypothetical protein